jgi:hypothetical protein
MISRSGPRFLRSSVSAKSVKNCVRPDGHQPRIDHGRRRAGGDHSATAAPWFGRDRDVAVEAAEDHDRIIRRLAVGLEPQAIPGARWIDDADALAGVERFLGDRLGAVALAAPGLAQEGHVVREGGRRDRMRHQSRSRIGR